VIVLDEEGRHVISLLSGHVGNANQWTRDLARALHSDPVITTATDTEGKLGLDEFAYQGKAHLPKLQGGNQDL